MMKNNSRINQCIFHIEYILFSSDMYVFLLKRDVTKTEYFEVLKYFFKHDECESFWKLPERAVCFAITPCVDVMMHSLQNVPRNMTMDGFLLSRASPY